MNNNELNLGELGVNLKQYRDNPQLAIVSVVAELRDGRISNGILVVDDQAEFVLRMGSQSFDAERKQIQFVELARNSRTRPRLRSEDPGLNGIYFSILPSEGDFAGFQRVTWGDGRQSVVDIQFNTHDGKGFLMAGYDLSLDHIDEAVFDQGRIVEFGGQAYTPVSYGELTERMSFPKRINLWQELGRIIFEPVSAQELRTRPLIGLT